MAVTRMLGTGGAEVSIETEESGGSFVNIVSSCACSGEESEGNVNCCPPPVDRTQRFAATAPCARALPPAEIRNTYGRDMSTANMRPEAQ